MLVDNGKVRDTPLKPVLVDIEKVPFSEYHSQAGSTTKKVKNGLNGQFTCC